MHFQIMEMEVKPSPSVVRHLYLRIERFMCAADLRFLPDSPSHFGSYKLPGRTDVAVVLCLSLFECRRELKSECDQGVGDLAPRV